MLEFKQIFSAAMGIIMSNVSADIFFLSYETITKQSLSWGTERRNDE